MRTNIKPEHRRLLEAIEYIDEEIVLGVLAGLKQPAETFEPGEYRKPSPFKYWKQFTAMAACLLLLSAAFPVLNYAVQRFGTGIWEGIAGAGTEVLEVPTQSETQALETENEITEAEVIDFDKALERYADMSAEEIYADVLKGGWIVQDSDPSSVFDAGEDIWQEFLLSVDNKNPITVLFADFNSSYTKVKLSKICYDGEIFTITQQKRDQTSALETETKEFKYFLRSRWPCYFFTNNPKADLTHIISSNSEDILNIDDDSFFVVIVQ